MSSPNPPTEEEIFEKVATAIAEQKDIDPSEVTMDATFESLAVDSLDGMEALFELEEALDVDVPDKAARTLLTPQTTVREIVEGLGKLTRGEEIEIPDPPSAAPDEAATDSVLERAVEGAAADAAEDSQRPDLPGAAQG